MRFGYLTFLANIPLLDLLAVIAAAESQGK